jgi:hypothetical protein
MYERTDDLGKRLANQAFYQRGVRGSSPLRSTRLDVSEHLTSVDVGARAANGSLSCYQLRHRPNLWVVTAVAATLRCYYISEETTTTRYSCRGSGVRVPSGPPDWMYQNT